MIFPEVEKERIIHTLDEDDTYAEYSGGDDDLEGDWNDEDDEVFDDMADDHHLPDEDI